MRRRLEGSSTGFEGSFKGLKGFEADCESCLGGGGSLVSGSVSCCLTFFSSSEDNCSSDVNSFSPDFARFLSLSLLCDERWTCADRSS